MDREDDSILLISEKILDEHTYGGSSWANSSLRTWLHSTFLKNSFSEQEIEQIIPANLTNSDGEDTIDTIFSLNKQEATKYFDEDSDRRAAQTTALHGSDGLLYGLWWLRGGYGVQGSGEICSGVGGGVRPALWLSTEGFGA